MPSEAPRAGPGPAQPGITLGLRVPTDPGSARIRNNPLCQFSNPLKDLE